MVRFSLDVFDKNHQCLFAPCVLASVKAAIFLGDLPYFDKNHAIISNLLDD